MIPEYRGKKSTPLNVNVAAEQTQGTTLIYAIHEASSPGRGHKKQAPTSSTHISVRGCLACNPPPHTAKNEWVIKGEELKVNTSPKK